MPPCCWPAARDRWVASTVRREFADCRSGTEWPVSQKRHYRPEGESGVSGRPTFPYRGPGTKCLTVRISVRSSELARPNPAKRADAAHHAVLHKELDVPARDKSSEKDDEHTIKKTSAPFTPAESCIAAALLQTSAPKTTQMRAVPPTTSNKAPLSTTKEVGKSLGFVTAAMT